MRQSNVSPTIQRTIVLFCRRRDALFTTLTSMRNIAPVRFTIVPAKPDPSLWGPA